MMFIRRSSLAFAGIQFLVLDDGLHEIVYALPVKVYIVTMESNNISWQAAILGSWKGTGVRQSILFLQSGYDLDALHPWVWRNLRTLSWNQLCFSF